MKTNRLYMFVLWGLLIVSIVLVGGENRQEHREIMSKLESMEQDLAKRDRLDSLYHEHLGQCSFIDKKSVKITPDGYVKLSYDVYKGYGKANK